MPAPMQQITKSFRRACVGLCGLWLCVLQSALAAAPMRYIYPPPETGSDVRMNYYWELLQAALEETAPQWGPFEMATSSKVINAARAELLLASISTEITVTVRTTSTEREKTLLSLRLPLDKGLTGYRLFLTKAATAQRLSNVRTLADLKEFSIGQAVNWIDTGILRDAGLNVVTGPSYDGLFNMLEANRFDLFSRGINEIGMEYVFAKTRAPDVVIDKYLLLYYPLPRYFFFARSAEGERLSRRVEEGIRKLMKNGKFEKRYQAFKRSLLVDLGLAGRRVLRIDNPYLSAATPLTDRELWDNLDNELKPGP